MDFYQIYLAFQFISIVEEGLKEASQQHLSKALILAAPTTIRLKLYERSAIKCIYPSAEEQNRVNQAIRNIASGKIESSEAQELKKMIHQIHQRDPFNGIILACTELPLLQRKSAISDTLPVIDTLQVLAKRLVEEAQ